MPPSRTGKSRGGQGGPSNMWAAGRNGGTKGGGPKRGGGVPKLPPVPKSFKKVVADYSQARYDHTARTWDESKLDAPNVDTVKFGRDFSIDDAVLEKLIARPSLCARLTTFIAGDPDTGSGTYVNEETLIRFIKLCPNMQLIALDSHTSLGKNSLLAILQSCPKLEALKITGHDRSSGKIDDAALIALAAACEADTSLASKLRDLCLVDQPAFEKGIRKLQKTRRLLIIHTGETAGNHAFARDDEYFTWKGGKLDFGFANEHNYSYW